MCLWVCGIEFPSMVGLWHCPTFQHEPRTKTNSSWATHRPLEVYMELLNRGLLSKYRKGESICPKITILMGGKGGIKW